MKVPKMKMRYCKKCRKHTEHKISIAKKRTPGSAHPLSKFSKVRSEFGKGHGNLGKFGSKPPVSKWKMTGKKQTKKTDFRYECKECKKTSVQRYGIRTKRVEFV